MQAAAAYYDFSALATLRGDVQQDSQAKLEEVAGQFEALFVQMMLKSMRDATPRGGLFDSHQLEGYEQMYDQQLAVELATQGGIGLSDVIMQQLDAAGSLRPGDEPPDFRPLPAERVPSLTGPGESADAGPAPAVEALTPATLTSETFVEQLRPLAEAAGRRLGVEADVLLAQAALETGWGRHVLQDSRGSSNNLFNIKAGSDWHGSTVRRAVLEFRDGVAMREVSSFRAYDSADQSFADYVAFLESSPRYDAARAVAGDSEAFLRELQRAGYATDPAYADKVIAVREQIEARATTHARLGTLKESAERTLTD